MSESDWRRKAAERYRKAVADLNKATDREIDEACAALERRKPTPAPSDPLQTGEAAN